MQSNFQEIVEALLPFLQALDRFGIPYYVGGSVASSYYGSWRRTQDVDVILAIRPDQIRTLAQQLAQDYDIDADAWIDSFRHGQPFNIFYQQTFTKIDVMPLQTAHRQEEARRAQPRSLSAGTPPIRLSSAEDTILAKLKWYKAMGGSKRQWTDILGVMRNQQSTLDLGYLRIWADKLGVRTELEQALVDAQSGNP
ncbi:MAG TPA: hypothetical protein VFV38_16405 [Ktedonobacteraceae bacterium]|nr:hypothetical protein [Ktedonobacteraceae bacterium]